MAPFAGSQPESHCMGLRCWHFMRYNRRLQMICVLPAPNVTDQFLSTYRTFALYAKGVSSQASVNLPFFHAISTEIFPLAFNPETRPSGHASGSAGNRWMAPA